MKRWPGRILDGVAEVVEEELEGDEVKTLLLQMQAIPKSIPMPSATILVTCALT